MNDEQPPGLVGRFFYIVIIMQLRSLTLALFSLLLFSQCMTKSELPLISPTVVTDKTPFDSDDPAIWIHPEDPSKSLVFGTDKDSQGGVYAFDLKGNLIREKSLTGIARPNNVDIEYGFSLNDSVRVDLLVFTERERQSIRIFSLPDLKARDGGGIPVFEDEKNPDYRLPMGISLYKKQKDSSIYAIVGRKDGPAEDYLYQYQLTADSLGQIGLRLARKFGTFSGQKEIEAIAVDDKRGFVYYSDEGVCIRKYQADPEQGSEELACFGGEYFQEDIEGIALTHQYMLVSDQQAGEFVVFDAQTNDYVHRLYLGTTETDGCEVTSQGLGPDFPGGLFVAMNDEQNFYFYPWNQLKDSIEQRR